MSDLEQTTKPWLLPLLHQKDRELPPFALALIAAWVFKTYRMMALANRAPNERDPVPHEHDRVLYEQGVPPSAASVFIGNSILSPYRPLFRPGWHPDVILWRPDEPPFDKASGPSSIQGDIYGATLGIGHFVAEVVGNTFDGGLTLLNIQPASMIADRMIRIWPIAAGIGPGGPVVWPPPPLSDDEVFATAAGLMEWFRALPLSPDHVRERHPPKGLQ